MVTVTVGWCINVELCVSVHYLGVWVHSRTARVNLQAKLVAKLAAKKPPKSFSGTTPWSSLFSRIPWEKSIPAQIRAQIRAQIQAQIRAHIRARIRAQIRARIRARTRAQGVLTKWCV